MRGWVVALAACGDARWGDAEGSLACDAGEVALWRVTAESFGRLSVEVDTVAAETTFDPYLEVYDVRRWAESAEKVRLGELLAEGNDQIGCSFAPGEHGCPRLATEVRGDVALIVGSNGECAGARGEYLVTADIDGVVARIEPLGLTTR